MEKGFKKGLSGLWLPDWLGGGDPANDGKIVIADSTQPGGVRLGPTTATVTSYIGSNVTLTSGSTWYNVTSVSLVAGTWLVLGTACYDNGAGGSACDLSLGPNSASASSAYVTTTIGGASTFTYTNGVIATILILAATTTVYLNAYCNTTGGTIKYQSYATTGPDPSGIMAALISNVI